MRVLVVSENWEQLERYISFLERLRFTVIPALDATSACHMYTRFASHYDLVIIDERICFQQQKKLKDRIAQYSTSHVKVLTSLLDVQAETCDGD